jgi:hypothetical protein
MRVSRYVGSENKHIVRLLVASLVIIVLSSMVIPTVGNSRLFNNLLVDSRKNSILGNMNAESLFSIPQTIPSAFAASLLVRVGQTVYVPGDELDVYGKGTPRDVLLITLYDPVGRAVKIDTVQVDANGIFRQTIFKWPEPSRNLVFGNYLVKVTSNKTPENNAQIQIIYAQNSQSGSDSGSNDNNLLALQHDLRIKLDSPDQVIIGKSFRIFVQVTFDGALLHSEDSDFLLGSSHIHSATSALTENSTISLSNKFQEIHDGLYYADVNLTRGDTYIIHAIAFYNGFLAHDSKVITASASSIGSIQDSVDSLSQKLNKTATELDLLEARLGQTQSTLNETRNSITGSLNEARDSIRSDIGDAKNAVKNVEDASGQLNSLILPVLALISVIIALQISLFARIRASYR